MMDRICGEYGASPVRPDYGERRCYYVSQAIRNEYGLVLEKLMLDGGFTCPNRDGTLSYGGCIFCSAGGSGDFAGDRSQSIARQIEEQIKKRSSKGKKPDGYIAYFQAFTGTYAPPDRLKSLYEEAAAFDEVKVISIATRPDCLGSEVLSVLTEVNEKKPVWLELGLQSIHKKTSDYINRGYDTETFEAAVWELYKRGIKVIVHVILGLPGETKEDMLETIDCINRLPVWGVKLQLLHILKGTGLEGPYLRGELSALTMDSYVNLVCECIRHLRPDISIHRLTGDGPADLLLAPLWSIKKRQVLNEINHRLKQLDIVQGMDYKRKEENMIKNLVFDVGGVLLQYRWKDMLMSYGLDEKEAVSLGRRLMESKPWTEGLDGGRMTVKEATEAICRLYPEDERYIRSFLGEFDKMSVPRPEVWEKINLLKRLGFRIYILSNYSGELLRAHLKDASFIPSLDGYLVSCELHIMKPDPKIYQALFDRYSLIPQECIFFDDRAENIEGSERMGMKGFLVKSREALNEKLDEIISKASKISEN